MSYPSNDPFPDAPASSEDSGPEAGGQAGSGSQAGKGGQKPHQRLLKSKGFVPTVVVVGLALFVLLSSRLVGRPPQIDSITPTSGKPGDVMIIDATGRRRMALARQPYSTLVAGIYSTKPGVLATPHGMDDPRLAGEVPLAIVGIVPCKVSAENGPIQAGDLLVTSATPGYAMKGTDHSRMLGAVVGKALGSLVSGKGVIEVLVTLQ